MRDWAEALSTSLHDRGADLFGYAYLLTGTDDEAADLLQVSVIRTFRTGYGSRGIDSAQADVRLAITREFVERARRSPESPSNSPFPVAKPAVDDQRVPASGTGASLRTTLLALPPAQRACVVLHYLEEVPVEEIAAHLKLPVGTVERHVADGVDQLSARHPDLDFTEVFTIAVGDGPRR